MLSSFEPSIFIKTFSIEQNESQAGLVIILVDVFADIPQIERKNLVTRVMIFLLFI